MGENGPFDKPALGADTPLMPSACDVLIIGGGPAGLRAAEVVSSAGLPTIVADQMPSIGRKFLVAGRGGLNLTHSEPMATFLPRYGEELDRWRDLLSDFSPDDLRRWASDLGSETFTGTSGRVFPLEKKAAPLLRRWIERLRRHGVEFRARHRLATLARESNGSWTAVFDAQGISTAIKARAVVLALGGASWPQSGSDGKWTSLLRHMDVALAPLVPANCGYEVVWPPNFIERCEGQPLKNIRVAADGVSMSGELLITRYGIEGGTLYQLGPILRVMKQPRVVIDLKPAFSRAQILAKLQRLSQLSLAAAEQACRLSPVATALLETCGAPDSIENLAERIKAFPVNLLGPRPLDEAISTAGGVAWKGLNRLLMLHRLPGLFCAGEMVDWEAPTGGYLLQGCLATGTRAGRGAIEFLQSDQTG